MSDYDNNNSGALYINDKRKGKQPHLRGFMELSNTKYWAAAWKKVSKDTGKHYLSIEFNEQDVEEPTPFYGTLSQVENPASEKAPNMEGSIILADETELRIVAWIRIASASNKPFYSIKVDEQASGDGDETCDDDFFFGFAETPEVEDTPAPQNSGGNTFDDFDDDIPF